MKSMRRAARSRSAGYGLDTLREWVIAPIIYLGPPIVCAAPLLLLYWLYRPTVLTNPGLGALKAPAAMAFLLPLSQPEFPEAVGTSNQAAPADVAEAFAEPEPADKKPKGPPGNRGSIASRHPLRFAANGRRPAPVYNVGAAVTHPGQYTGTSRSASFAYAYAVEQSGRHWW